MFYTPDTLFKRWGIPGMAQFGECEAPVHASFCRQWKPRRNYLFNSFYWVALPDDYTVAGFRDPFGGGRVFGAETRQQRDGVKNHPAGLELVGHALAFDSWPAAAKVHRPPKVHGSAAGASWPCGLEARGPTEVTLSQENGKSTPGAASEGSGPPTVTMPSSRRPEGFGARAGAGQADLRASYPGAPLRSVGEPDPAGFETDGGLSSDESQVSGATAIAFAGEHVAVRRPIADSFAILLPQTRLIRRA